MKEFFTPNRNKFILKLAGAYGLIWAFVIFFLFDYLSFLTGPRELWLYTALNVGIFGVGFLIASIDPSKHWPIVLLGFITKIGGVLLYLVSLTKEVPGRELLLAVIFDDLIWIVPFYYILNAAYEDYIYEESPAKRYGDMIKNIRTNQGQSLFELSESRNVLLVFIRHFGCTFCRQTVSELAKLEEAIRHKNLELVYVHMSDPSFGDEFFSKYYEHKIHHISDPRRILYKSFGLSRGTLLQVFGPMTFIRGLWAGVFKGHGLGEIEGDSLQLGGFFVLKKGQVIFEKKNSSASEIFDLSTISLK